MTVAVYAEKPRNGRVYDDATAPKHVPTDLLHRDMMIFEGMKPLVNCYGSTTIPTGEVHYVYGCVVGRTQKNSVMSENWAQDTTPQNVGGNREMNQIKILAPEWHGDFYSRVWFNGSCYEVDGSPVYLPHSSDLAKHYEFPARRVYAPELAVNHIDPPTVPEDAKVWGM